MASNDNQFTYVKEETTVIMDTTEKYVIDESFVFGTATCLIYAEIIEIVSDVTIPGKNLGLFCHDLRAPEPVKIDISGLKGKHGISRTNVDGETGGDGGNSGSLWVYVQKFKDGDLKNLELRAFGGDGGQGGDTSGLKSDKLEKEEGDSAAVKGGTGGKGGKGGLIEISLGTSPTLAIAALRAIDKQPWPTKLTSLLIPESSKDLAKIISHEDRDALIPYQHLNNALQKLYEVLLELSTRVLSGNDTGLVSPVLDQLRNISKPGRPSPDVNQTVIDGMYDVIKKLRLQENLDQSMKETAALIKKLSPSSDSGLEALIDMLWETVKLQKSQILAAVQPKMKNNNGGASGAGGHSGPGVLPGPRGAKGDAGQTRLLLLELNGSERDTDVTQAYVFPEQCQMLLNKVDSQFYGMKKGKEAEVILQYERLIQRLHITKAFGIAGGTSGLGKALNKLETELKITRNSVGQLEAIYGQAKTRRNRLLLGQDMLGHSAAWVPRLSYDYYTETLKDRLAVLREVEDIETQYHTALKNNAETTTLIAKGTQKMQDALKEAQKKVNLLAGQNGLLSQTADKISALTIEMREKRETVKDKIARVHLMSKFDLLNAISTLTTLSKDFDSLKKLYGLYKEATGDVKNTDGERFSKEYVIGQLSECAGSLQSLESAIKTAENNTVSLDDPGALKVMAKRDDITKIIDSFSDDIPSDSQEEIRTALDEYVETTLLRNQAVLDYNSSIQLLLEARHEEEYDRAQIASLSDSAIKLDPTIPAVAFWLRRTRDSLRLQLMQRLDLASRAVRFWGLTDTIEYSQSGPLQNSTKLDLDRTNLDRVFEDILNRYSGNIRSTWPSNDDQQGLFYDLTDSQRKSLTTGAQEHGSQGMVYKVSISLKPGDIPFGNGRADVRLNEARLWLIGATVQPDGLNRQRVLVHLDHMGQDAFQDERHNQLNFSHDIVSIPFEFDAAQVKSVKDLTNQVKLNRTIAMKDDWTGGRSRDESSIAAIGPFATWRLVVREVENLHLNMAAVTSAHLEFRGANRSFKHSVLHEY